ncbi:MAG: protein-glutamate O-methyltransferase CheR [Halieaceae bacterium]|jgi:chemotaxis protein methyltransferase CheR|nr:protein-glutamate O-methyltransferase CheR [Halieaceae bacterium]
MSAHPVSDREFRDLAEFVRSVSGIQLDQSKSYLIETRLGPLLDELSLKDYGELCRKASVNPGVRSRIIDEISTNETSFFRDRAPFEMLKYKLIPDAMDRLRSHETLSIWSAASSTGQEVYSIAIACAEVLPARELSRLKILGTDISDKAIRAASIGSYSNYEIERGMEAALRDKYMIPDGDRWRVRDDLRALASFRQANLLEPMSFLGSFDVIFCRNVAIYFDLATRKALFERLGRMLRPRGALVVGSSETLHGVADQFERKDHLRSFYYSLR